MEVSGQLHAPAALPPENKPPVLIGYLAGGAPEPVLDAVEKEKNMLRRESNPRRPARRYADWATPTPREGRWRAVTKALDEIHYAFFWGRSGLKRLTVDMYERFDCTCCLHLQGDESWQLS
jgi:hypothetical protein